jgi:transposase-like protein
MSIPPRRELNNLFSSNDDARKYLLERRVFYFSRRCSRCLGPASLNANLIRCTTDGCRKSVSLFAHSFFARSRLKLNETLELAYYWLCGSSYNAALTMTGHSSPTVTEYYRFFRELVSSSLEDTDICIGGEGIIVEIDESKFGRRKYNRGHAVEGAWVVGGIERTSDRKFFAEVVNMRDAVTLLDIIDRHVLPGSIVHTDCWRGYDQLSRLIGLEHHQVNHSKEYVNKIDGTHTNTIEAKWGALKRKISIRGRVKDHLQSHLMEQIWRNKHCTSLWTSFIDALRDVHYS